MLETLTKNQSAIKIDGMFNAILGAAGTGKSYWLKQQLNLDPDFALVTSSTGISALNVDGQTIHSVLKYYNTLSLIERYKNGQLHDSLIDIAKKYKYLCIDEISMLPGEQLKIICHAIYHINQQGFDLKLIVLGDAAQLPTIQAQEFFFETKPWAVFNQNSLTEVKRQANKEFINFLHSLRTGDVCKTMDWFKANIGFSEIIESDFQGTTILSTNRDVDRYNAKALAKIKGNSVSYEKITVGKPKPEWKQIAERVTVKPGSKVILTVNNHKEGYCNGDLATVTRCLSNSVEVTLDRNGYSYFIGYIERVNIPAMGKVSVGSLQYLPLRLAYALTIHRTQGLTLDKLQCRISDSFIRNLSGGLYVIFSRIRDFKNLKVVGNENYLLRANYVDPKIKEFLISYESHTT